MNDEKPIEGELQRPGDPSQETNRRLTLVVYGLQAAVFFTGITFVIALIINYVKREDVAGTWLEAHFRWQIRTFWFGLLWFVLGWLTLILIIGKGILFANVLWVIYRIAKGVLRLLDGRSPYPAATNTSPPE